MKIDSKVELKNQHIKDVEYIFKGIFLGKALLEVSRINIAIWVNPDDLRGLK